MTRIITVLLSIAVIVISVVTVARARDQGQWEATPQDVRDWYRNLKQPDNPGMSCCGEADAYWADSFAVVDGTVVATITDTREDGPLGRPHVPPGTRVAIPTHKYKFDAGNPTGHGVVFLGRGTGDDVYEYNVLCYVTPGGV